MFKNNNGMSAVMQRQGPSTMTDRAYNALIGGVLTWGFLLTAVICYFAKDYFINFMSQSGLNLILFIVGYIVCTLLGSVISAKSSNPVVSFIGYNIVVIPTGLLISGLVACYSGYSVIQAIAVTGMVTLLMFVLGTLFPAVFLKMSRVLFLSLIIVIILETVMYFLGWMSNSTELLINGVVALIFSLYIGYDWSRAQQAPKTADNAVDICVALYMDIVNLFIRLLSIFGRND